MLLIADLTLHCKVAFDCISLSMTCKSPFNTFQHNPKPVLVQYLVNRLRRNAFIKC